MKNFILLKLLLCLPVFAALDISEHNSQPLGILQNNEGNNGSTRLSSSISKGQSFRLTTSSQISGFSAKVVSVTTASDITLSIYATLNGVPTGPALFSDSSNLPTTPIDGTFLEFTFPSPVNLGAGEYAIILETKHSDLSFRLNTAAASFSDGSLIKNTGTAWSTVSSDFVFTIIGENTTPARPPASTGPNIVFILVDDFGWTDHSVAALAKGYQSSFYQTPNMQRLASEGVSFTSAYAQPNCAPTRAVLLSGQYAPRSGNGVYNVDKLNRQEGRTTYTTAADQGDEYINGDDTTITIGEALYHAGYVTAHFGKYHAGASDKSSDTHPLKQGFEFNYGGNNWGNPGSFFASTNGKFGSKIGAELDPFAAPYTTDYITQNLLPYANGNDPTSLAPSLTDPTSVHKKHLTDAMGDAFISFMNDHRNGENSAYPVYAQLHFYAVHTPIQGRSDLVTKYKDIKASASYVPSKHSGAGYAALVENMDHSLGRVLDYLDDPNGDGNQEDSLAENTVIIFTSDNGGAGNYTSNSPLRGSKGMHYEGGIRVPLIIRQPGEGNIPANKVSDALVHCVDYYPTMLDFAKATYPNTLSHPLDGESLHAHLLDPDNIARSRSPIFYHFPGYMDNRAYACSVAIKDVAGKRYKYIYAYDPYYNPGSGTTDGYDQYQLYNLSDDMSESTNLMDFIDIENPSDSDDPSTPLEYWNYIQYQKVANELADDLHNWLKGSPDDQTWNPLYTTYSADYPGIDPALVGQSTGPAPATIAQLTIAKEKQFRVTALKNDLTNNITLSFPSEAGLSYQIQVNSSLDEESWVNLGAPISATGTSTTHTTLDPDFDQSPQRFYRVRVSHN